MLTKSCNLSGCERLARSKGSQYCEAHYYRLRRTGSHELPTYPDSRVGADGYVIDRNRASTRFTRQHRRVLWEKIGPGVHACHNCGRQVDWAKRYPREADGLVVDHLDWDKTNNHPDNLAPSCGLCNMHRHREHAGLTPEGL